jgi:hypothetical protein
MKVNDNRQPSSALHCGTKAKRYDIRSDLGLNQGHQNFEANHCVIGKPVKIWRANHYTIRPTCVVIHMQS